MSPDKIRNNVRNKIYNKDSTKFLKDRKYFPDNSIDFIMTSPPYSDKRKNSYGGVHPNKYVEWFLPISEQLHRILNPKGSFVMNIKEGARNGQRETYVLELILEMKKQQKTHFIMTIFLQVTQVTKMVKAGIFLLTEFFLVENNMSLY